jgi:hypothetical protein
MYSFDKLVQLYNKTSTSNSDNLKTHYIDNLIDNIKLNSNNYNYLLDFIIINKIHYNIENYIKFIYILVPILFTYTYIYGFKHFINMI